MWCCVSSYLDYFDDSHLFPHCDFPKVNPDVRISPCLSDSETVEHSISVSTILSTMCFFPVGVFRMTKWCVVCDAIVLRTQRCRCEMTPVMSVTKLKHNVSLFGGCKLVKWCIHYIRVWSACLLLMSNIMIILFITNHPAFKVHSTFKYSHGMDKGYLWGTDWP